MSRKELFWPYVAIHSHQHGTNKRPVLGNMVFLARVRFKVGRSSLDFFAEVNLAQLEVIVGEPARKYMARFSLMWEFLKLEFGPSFVCFFKETRSKPSMLGSPNFDKHRGQKA